MYSVNYLVVVRLKSVLTDPENILTGGIDLHPTTRKKRQQLTLLSGVENEHSVIALLFSFL